MPNQQTENRNAVFSPCRTWRYALTIQWDDTNPLMMVVGLNPSTADEVKDDPTIRRCKGFARQWGYGGLVMANGFAYRATNPKDMQAAGDPNGPQNDCELQRQASRAAFVLAAWGNHCPDDREMEVYNLITAAGHELHCLGTNMTGKPKHPLYVAASKPPEIYLPTTVSARLSRG